MRTIPALLLLVAAAHAQGRGRALTFDVRDRAAKDVIVIVALTTRADIRLDQEFNDAKLTMKVEGIAMRECLDMIAAAVGAQVFRRGGDYHIVSPWKHKILTTLHEGPKVTFTFQNESVRKVLNVVATYSGVPMVIDPRLPADLTCTLNVANFTSADVINQMLAPHKAQYDLRYGVAFIATRERLAALPKLPPVKGKPIQDVTFTFSFENQAGLPVVDTIAKRAGLTPEIQPDAKKVLEQAKYTFQMKGTSFPHALAAILAPVGAEAEVIDKKLVIRLRASAAITREEMPPDRKLPQPDRKKK